MTHQQFLNFSGLTQLLLRSLTTEDYASDVARLLRVSICHDQQLSVVRRCRVYPDGRITDPFNTLYSDLRVYFPFIFSTVSRSRLTVFLLAIYPKHRTIRYKQIESSSFVDVEFI